MYFFTGPLRNANAVRYTVRCMIDNNAGEFYSFAGPLREAGPF